MPDLKNVLVEPLVEQQKIIHLHPPQEKLGLINIFVKALNSEGNAFFICESEIRAYM